MQNALLKATKETTESKEFHTLKKPVKQSHNTHYIKEKKEQLNTSINTRTPYMNQEDVQYMASSVPNVAEQSILNGFAEAYTEE